MDEFKIIINELMFQSPDVKKNFLNLFKVGKSSRRKSFAKKEKKT